MPVAEWASSLRRSLGHLAQIRRRTWRYRHHLRADIDRDDPTGRGDERVDVELGESRHITSQPGDALEKAFEVAKRDRWRASVPEQQRRRPQRADQFGRIQIRQAPLARRNAKTPSKAPDPAEVARLAAGMTDIADDDLRGALARLGASVKRT